MKKMMFVSGLAVLLVLGLPLVSGAIEDSNVVVVVNADLKPLIENELTRYVSDLDAEGYAVTVKEWDLGTAGQKTPADLKAYLAGCAGLDGAVFIGDLPVAIYNHAEDAWTKVFPCDFYFMSLTTVWTNTDADRDFEQIDGTPTATIWVSRIKASNMSTLYSGLTEDELVRRYLDKNHRFRTGQLRLEDRALLWAQDDWAGQTPSSVGLASAYTNCTRKTKAVVPAVDMTWSVNWNVPYETEYFMCHSSATKHSTTGGGNTSVANADIQRLFWNCWNCGSGNFTVSGYVAGARLFTPVHGLLAVASTKTGSMYPFAGFYNHLGAGKGHGYAFMQYWNLDAALCNTSAYYKSWRFGLTLLGDGTLRLGRHAPAAAYVNAAPVAAADTFATGKNIALSVGATLGVLRNDRDPDANPLSAQLISGVQHGTLSLNSNGSFLYTPSVSFCGTDSFQYRVSDGTLYSDSATVTLTVVNNKPVAANQAVSTELNQSAAITLSATDPNGDPLTYTVLTQPSHGTLSGSGKNVTYAPDAGYVGTDSFTFKANDGMADSSAATVTITITDLNDAPTVTLTSPANGSILPAGNISLLATASDVDGTIAKVEFFNGATRLGEDTTSPYAYTWTGVAQGSYTLTAKATDNNGAITTSAAVTITVTSSPANEPPTANAKSVTTAEDTATAVTLTGSDPEGSNLTYTVVTQPAHGTVTPGAGASRTYTPDANYNGADSFTFKVNDGALDSTPATVSITVTPVNDNPVIDSPAWADANPVVLPAGTAVHVVASDPDSDPLTCAWTKVSGAGTATFAAPGAVDSGVTFSAAGTYILRVTVNDGKGGSASSEVTVMVNEGGGGTDPGDLTGDGMVNIDDLVLVVGHFGQGAGDPNWDARADGNRDGVVNITDLTLVTSNFGKTY